MNNLDEIIPAFETTLFDPAFTDVCLEIAEAGMDSVVDNPLLNSIPFASILLGVGKTAKNFHDRNLLKQTAQFINAFNCGNISEQKLVKYREKFNKNPQKAEEELGRVLTLLDRNIELKKSKILGHFYRSYVNEDIKWDQFCELSDVNEKLFISDIQLLRQISNKEITQTNQCKMYRVERLNAVGLVNTATNSITISDRGGATNKMIEVSELGSLFCQYGIN